MYNSLTNLSFSIAQDHLREHLSTHGTSRPFSCDSCKKQFVRNEHLARHKLCSPSCSGELASPLFGKKIIFVCDVFPPLKKRFDRGNCNCQGLIVLKPKREGGQDRRIRNQGTLNAPVVPHGSRGCVWSVYG
jgi:hypothetical protein